MALIKCPECRNMLEDNKDICPNCGYPIKKELLKEKKKERERKTLFTKYSILFKSINCNIFCFSCDIFWKRI